MEVPKNSYACAICQKRFNNPIILIKHVEFRHSLTKQSSKADDLKEKVAVTDSNQMWFVVSSYILIRVQ